MPLSTDDLIEVLEILAKDEDLKVTVSESLKGGVLVGTTTVIGGLLGGPIGLALGGAVGGLIAAANASGTFKSVPQVLAEMEPHHRKELARRFKSIFKDVNVYDVATALMILNSNTSLLQKAMGILTNYITNDLQMKISQKEI